MRFLLAIVLLLVVLNADGQEKQKSFSLELGGLAGIYSFNIETEFKTQENRTWSHRFGLGGLPIDKNNGIALYFPMAIDLSIGNEHKLNFEAGQTVTVTTKGSFHVLTTLGIGYKLEPSDKNWFLRVHYTPLISLIYDFQYQNWAGVGIGIKLKQK